VPELTVAANIFLGREPYAAIPGFISRRRAEAEARQLLNDLHIDLPPRARISDLSVARRQLVEIAKGVAAAPKILILDESSSSLTAHEIGELFRVARTLAQRGTAIIYITHKLDEVFALTDRITVLRDGRLIATQPAGAWTENSLIRAMVGREISALYPRTDAKVGEPALELRSLSRRGRFHNVSLQVRRGEIVGMYGLIGSGRTELAESIFGLDPADRGETLIGGRRVVIRSPQDALRHGLALVPEDRRGRGLVISHSVRTNLSLRALRALSRLGVVDRRRETAAVTRMRDALAIRMPSLGAPVAQLSGGNQQKVVIGKWLMVTPDILILDEPTRGIDVGAKAEVHAIIDRLAAAGMAVMLISSELPEVLRMSDRVLVMRAGRLAGEFRRHEATEEAVVSAAAAAETAGAAG
jgi:ABC-type sugar transport system ATPase subunit